MNDFGWLLFMLGVLILAVSGAIGMDAGNLRVANLSGIIAGITCMVGGAVFVIGGRIAKRLPKNETQIAEASVQTEPVEASVPKVESASLSPKAIETAPNSSKGNFP